MDVTAHEILSRERIREIHHAVGGAAGGTAVDKAFEDMMARLLGAVVLARYLSLHQLFFCQRLLRQLSLRQLLEYVLCSVTMSKLAFKNHPVLRFRIKKECPQEWLSFMTMFEKAKKRLRPDGVSNVRLAIPMSFGVVYTQETTYNMADILPSVCGNHGVEFRQSHIIFSNDAALKLFEGAVAGITRVVDNVIAQPQLANCRFVLLVGGFSESGVVQEAVRRCVETKCPATVLVPNDAQMCVLRGAVLFGHSPETIRTRKAKYTYGIGVTEAYQWYRHRPDKLVYRDGLPSCRDLMSVIVEKGQDIEADYAIRRTFNPSEFNAREVRFKCYALDDVASDPQYTDAPGVRKLGCSMVLKMPNTTGGRRRRIEMKYEFGGTEMKIRAYDPLSKNREEINIDLLAD